MKPANTTPTALLLVDVQRGFDHPTHWGGARSTPSFEANVTTLLASFRSFSASHPAHIIHVHHHSGPHNVESPFRPSATVRSPAGSSTTVRGTDPQPYASPLPGEPVFIKTVNSAFVGTPLEAYLREHKVRQLVIVGLTTDHCVSTTTRMAANLKVLGDEGGVDGSGGGAGEHGVLLVRDAVATYAKGGIGAEDLHRAHLVSLDGEFCRVVGAGEVLEGVLGLKKD